MTGVRLVRWPHLVLLALLFGVSVLGYVMIPAGTMVPVHWGLDGTADAFLPREWALLLGPAIGLGGLALFAGIERFGSEKAIGGGRYLLDTGLLLIIGLALVLQGASVMIGMGIEVNVVRVVTAAVGVMLVVIGNRLPKSQPSSFAGIRLRSTLNDPANWAATHRLTGLAFMVSGILLLIGAWLIGSPEILLTLLSLAVSIPILLGVAYSYRRAQ